MGVIVPSWRREKTRLVNSGSRGSLATSRSRQVYVHLLNDPGPNPATCSTIENDRSPSADDRSLGRYGSERITGATGRGSIQRDKPDPRETMDPARWIGDDPRSTFLALLSITRPAFQLHAPSRVSLDNFALSMLPTK